MNLKHLHYFFRVATLGSVARAGEELHVTPQTISGQLQLLEEELKAALFVRRGRRLELTEAGRLALGYAKDIFALEAELAEVIRLTPAGRATEFRVGVSDAVPKPLAYRLLEPATRVADPVRIVCLEWKLDALLSELAVHRLDLVLADAPLPRTVHVHAYSHRLGTSTLTFVARPDLAKRYRGAFPACLDASPMLLPGRDSALRTGLVQWLSKHKLRPRFVGEFDGVSLMSAFGVGGFGVFATPSILAAETCAQHGVTVVGTATDLSVEYFAISVQRRLTHPCVLAVTEVARQTVFASEDAPERMRAQG